VSPPGSNLTEIQPNVLMVDDEKEVADAYALRLEGVADVTVAYGGTEALETLERRSPPDVVLLDRHMPGTSGDDVLEAIRERDLRTRVIMITAVDPGLDIVDLPFDDYLCKPVERSDLRAAIDQQCQILAYELLGEYFEVASKRAVIAAEVPVSERDDDTEFTALGESATRLKSRLERVLPEAEEVLSTFAAINRRRY